MTFFKKDGIIHIPKNKKLKKPTLIQSASLMEYPITTIVIAPVIILMIFTSLIFFI